MKVSKLNSLTYLAEYDYKEPVNILLISDVHFDNPKCNRDLLFSHLDKAKKLGYKVAIFGDLFCMMQGKYDPRRSKKDILFAS
jgi:UDP-2,3-diacylglucosamine pyrophosphatase LpxH